MTLRPRAFIPYWNKDVYKTYIDWAKWYWKGAVHINDVTQAVMKGIDFLTKQPPKEHFILPVDGAYEFTHADLKDWDKNGSGTTFKKYYAKHYDTVVKFGLDPSLMPTIQDISATKKLLGYEPRYSLKNLLEDLEKYGEQGPPANS